MTVKLPKDVFLFTLYVLETKLNMWKNFWIVYIIQRTLSDCDFFWSWDAVMRLIYLYDADLVLHVLLFCLLHKNSLLSTGFHCLFCLLTIMRLLTLFKEHTWSPIELRSCLFSVYMHVYTYFILYTLNNVGLQ